MTSPYHRGLTPEHLADIEQAREYIAAELPDLVARERRMREAAEENTFSGELRRAIYAGDRDLISLADQPPVPGNTGARMPPTPLATLRTTSPTTGRDLQGSNLAFQNPQQPGALRCPPSELVDILQGSQG